MLLGLIILVLCSLTSHVHLAGATSYSSTNVTNATYVEASSGIVSHSRTTSLISDPSSEEQSSSTHAVGYYIAAGLGVSSTAGRQTSPVSIITPPSPSSLTNLAAAASIYSLPVSSNNSLSAEKTSTLWSYNTSTPTSASSSPSQTSAALSVVPTHLNTTNATLPAISPPSRSLTAFHNASKSTAPLGTGIGMATSWPHAYNAAQCWTEWQSWWDMSLYNSTFTTYIQGSSAMTSTDTWYERVCIQGKTYANSFPVSDVAWIYLVRQGID